MAKRREQLDELREELITPDGKNYIWGDYYKVSAPSRTVKKGDLYLVCNSNGYCQQYGKCTSNATVKLIAPFSDTKFSLVVNTTLQNNFPIYHILNAQSFNITERYMTFTGSIRDGCSPMSGTGVSYYSFYQNLVTDANKNTCYFKAYGKVNIDWLKANWAKMEVE